MGALGGVIMRIKYIKDHKTNKRGDIALVSPNVAFGLIDSGVAEVTKDMQPDDYKQAGDNNGFNIKLRTNKPSRR